MILSAQSIRKRVLLARGPEWASEAGKNGLLNIEPFFDQAQIVAGMTFGLGPAGYDIRIGKIDRQLLVWNDSYNDLVEEDVQSWNVAPGDFVLLSSLERVTIPFDILASVVDKSSMARKGLALQNTVLEPGWEGYITLELSNHSDEYIEIMVGQPIAQIVFMQLDQPTDRPYQGRYQNQPDKPVYAIHAEPTSDS